jgi:hypothetical protein
MGPIGIQELLLILFLLAGLASMIFWVWMLVDCTTKESDQGNNKIVWMLIILFGNIVGALIYMFVRRPQRLADLHR